jgi:PAS domain S-box-containing protein
MTLLLATLVLFIFLLSLIYRDVKKQMIRELNAQQMVHAGQAVRGIKEHMHQLVTTLNTLARFPEIIDFDGEGMRTMAYFDRSRGEEIKGITRVDARGRIIYSLPFMEGTIGRDISGQEHIREITKTHKPVVSDVFMTVQGFSAIAVHVPVFKGEKYAGTIAFLLSFDHIAKNYIENIRVGVSGYAWVITRKGIEISCPVPGHMGRGVTDTCKDFPEILAMAKEMVQGKSGVTTYHFNRVRGKNVEKVLKHVVYMPIPLYNTFWSIVVATPEDEVIASMEGLRRKFLVITVLLFAFCALIIYLLVRSRVVAREEKKRESLGRALEESEALYRALIETTNTGFVIIGKDGRVIDANREYVRLTGHRSLDEIRGRSVLEWTGGQDKEKNDDALTRCMLEGSVSNLEIDYFDGAGNLTPVEINATLVTRDGLPTILAICRDIKDRKRLENQLMQARKMESVGRLAGGVAHDFNNVLSVIIGHAELALSRVSPTDALHRSLIEILKAGKHSAALTSQLLAFARKQIITPRILDLNKTVSGMLTMLRRLIGEDIHLTWIPGDALWNVRIDPSQIDQILANLLLNAKDAMAGMGTITIETANTIIDDDYCTLHPEGIPGEYVALTVNDDGCGMDEEVLANVFEPFFTTKGVGEGTGLGLATVYGIVKQNNGFINISSGLKKGTTVRILLPRSQSETVDVLPEPETQVLPRGSETILLVEDDEAVLNLAKGLLEELGYTVLTASKPGQAIPLAEANRDALDLVITDVIMPEMNGRDMMEKLKSVIPTARYLFISGYTADVIARHGVLEEDVPFLEKPFSVRTLANKVRSILDGK